MRSPLLTENHRAKADRRDGTGAIVSLNEARELYRRRIDRDHQSSLVIAVYLRGVEIGDDRVRNAAVRCANEIELDIGDIATHVGPMSRESSVQS